MQGAQQWLRRLVRVSKTTCSELLTMDPNAIPKLRKLAMLQDKGEKSRGG